MSHNSKPPTNWDEVFACDCHFCTEFAKIHRQCHDTGKFLFVFDCREYGVGYTVGDMRRMFIEPAIIHQRLGLIDAVRIVLDEQGYCDAMTSNFPNSRVVWRCHSFIEAAQVTG